MLLDHIQLTRITTIFSEATEVNGAIIVLDQAMAHDKVTCGRYWKPLACARHFGVTVFSSSSVVPVGRIDPTIPRRSRVSRGIRQKERLGKRTVLLRPVYVGRPYVMVST